MKEVQVPGVLNINSKTRDEHLKRNYGKYFLYTENLAPAIGEAYDIDYNRPLYSITDNKPLLEYTHDGNQTYGNSINRKYFNKNRKKDIYSVKELNFDQIQAWGGDYTDYITYLDDVLGEDIYSRHVRYINDFLSGQYMENALRQTEVGVVRNINVPIARQGTITTNPNNLKGLDTPLGTITNYMYSTLLYNGAIFNSDRKSESKYITPSLINQYGNNLSNVSKLGDMLRVGVGDYELREDLGADAHIIHSFKDAVGDLNIAWLTKNVENAKKYLSEFNEGFGGYELGKDGYVNYIDGKNKNLDLSDFTSKSQFVSLYKSNTDKTYDTYNESDKTGQDNVEAPSNEDDAAWEHYESIETNEDDKSILGKTARLYNEHKINTLIGRFHTSVDGGISPEQEFIDTAKSRYGNSHGRNLLTRKAQDSETADADDTNGYDNPYCRTWTYHHQYNQVKKLIRPFITVDDNGEEKAMSVEAVQRANGKYRSRFNNNKKLNGEKYLGRNTVLNDNGFVNICPSGDQSVTDTTNADKFNANTGTRIEKCMFSIENLAWKDVPKFTKENYISKEQTGPNGGRIMWFPPYDLSFSENVNVGWNESTFIGRGEKVYTYTNTDRTGTLSFTLLIDHPSIVNTFSRLEDGDLSSDIDSDILRYFAGCDIPVIKEDEEEKKGEAKDDTGIEELENHGEIKFYVYFPNNYSGMVSKHTNKLNDDDKDIPDYDNEWWTYILAGNNCSIKEDENLWVGYEVTENYGISRIFANNHKEYTEEQIKEIKQGIQGEWIGVSQCWWDNKGLECISKVEDYSQNDAVDKYGNKVVQKEGEDAGNWCYKYRVDKDLRQKLGRYLKVPNPQNVSFEDGNSLQLNTLLSEYQKDANCTFGEFIGALILSKKIKNENTSIDTDKLLEFLKGKFADSERIENISNIISADGIKFDRIIIEGSADQNDKDNADMLAARRANSIKRLLNDNDIKTENFKCDGKKSNETPDEIANAVNNKLQRFSFVTIKYTLPDAKQTLSSMSEDATNKKPMTYEEEMEDEDKFNKWFEFLVEQSTLFNEYNEIFDNEDYEKNYQLFKEDVKKWCIDNNVSYDDTESQDWDSIINGLSEEYGYSYFIPADKINSFGNDFTDQLRKHKPINVDEKIDNEISKLSAELVQVTEELNGYIKDVSGLTEELNNLKDEKGFKDLELRIEECEEKITCYKYGGCETPDAIIDCQSGTTQYQSEIDRINYELNHWTTEKGDKKALTKELQRCEKEKSKLETKIGEENVKKEKYEQELEEINGEIDNLTEEIKKYEDKELELSKELASLSEELVQLGIDKDNGKGLSVDKVKSEIYFERFNQNITNILDKLNGCGENGVSSDFNYHKFANQEEPREIGEDTNLFETGIVLKIPDGFPYDGCNGYKGFVKIEYPGCTNADGENAKMSYNLLLKEYLLVKLLDENIDGSTNKGFEFACDYLMSNQESETREDATNDDVSDYEQIKDLLFIQYLLSGVKSEAEYPTEQSGNKSWNTSPESTDGNSSDISYYDAWEYMIENRDKLSIVYEPFTHALDEVETAIKEYRFSYNDTEYDHQVFDKMMKVIKSNTASVLKYCATVIDDIMLEVIGYANTAASDAAKAAEDAYNDKNGQRLKKKYQSECDTLNNLKDSVDKKRDQFLYSVFVGSGYTRYETESEYFEKLNIEHPLIFKSIKEKFKYFNPAFHSMSPEGFNARLNFLHQCTRQGHTYEAKSENGVKTAHNLAFGRMPVCVLRIGDFINTRIIINNVNINYDNGGMQWDLNPEGIGVQPMYAKVNLGITIIGGQSLNGPINRLQNAVSFDYYANTGVYDNRADRIHRDANGNIVYDYIFNIDPKVSHDTHYTLYQTGVSLAETANSSTIDSIKANKEQYDKAKKDLNDYKLTDGNDQCEK